MKLKLPSKNKPVFKLFPELYKLIEKNKCPLCRGDVKEFDFKDELSKKEYSISGICFKCQKEIFK
jgi:hypothetical protein